MNDETMFWIRAALTSLTLAEEQETTRPYERFLADAIWQVQMAIKSLEKRL